MDIHGDANGKDVVVMDIKEDLPAQQNIFQFLVPNINQQ